MNSSLIEILCACLIMGVGIGADVALATFLRARSMNNKRTVLFWIFGVTLTHTLFPMVGYLLAHFSINNAPMISPIVGVVAFSFIAYFVIQELKIGSEDDSETGHAQLLVTLGLILSVSWDALWSGPAKSAQVIGWSEFWVWSSFLIVGIVVALFSIVSYLLAKKVSPVNCQPKWVVFDMGQWIQLSVVSYFGLLALLRYTFDVKWSWWILLLASFLLIAIVLYRINSKRLSVNIHEEKNERNMNYISLT
jgi:hypothetical protein